jgi:hypothetical protein
MASISESGHAKNVANFEKLITSATSLGTAYNPSKTSLSIEALNNKFTASSNAITAINNAAPAYKNAVSARDAAFAPLGKLITRVNNALKASESTEQVDESALTIVRKLQGRRANPKLSESEKKVAAENGKTVSEISTSQMSYDIRLDNLDKLIKLLASIPEYSPNEPDLSIESLTTLYNDLRTRNITVTTANVPLTNARIARNDILYKKATGLVDISVDVKTYIKSVFGATSPQYKAISSLKFIKYAS